MDKMEIMVDRTNLIKLDLCVYKETGMIREVWITFTESDNLGYIRKVTLPFKQLHKKTTRKLLEDRFIKCSKALKYELGR
ncbi:hypothetical protein BK146_24620 [Paenibacillus sp. FSL R7-0333]|nr:hypothetical protein BK146_24620 [Paenibacillus sp. FSL R7-0333]